MPLMELGALNATFNYDPVITDGTASVYINGTSAFLKYSFKDVQQPFSGTVNLGQIGRNFASGGDDSKAAAIYYDHKFDKIRFVVKIDTTNTETDLRVYYAPDGTRLVDQSQQIAGGALNATFNYDPVITNGTASVYINGTSAFLKYSFKDVQQSFSGTVNLGQIGRSLAGRGSHSQAAAFSDIYYSHKADKIK
ncbi:hypothetical protein H0H87_010308, partial [Tephrocybe sp. NHM501043]